MKKTRLTLKGLVLSLLLCGASFSAFSSFAEGVPRFAFDHHVTVVAADTSFSAIVLPAGTPGVSGEFFSFQFEGGMVPLGVFGSAQRQACFLGGACAFLFPEGTTPRSQSFQFSATSRGVGVGLRSLPGTVFIEVVASIDEPLAFRQDIKTIQNEWIPFQPQGVSPGGEALTFSVTRDPANGSLRDDGFDRGGFIYEPNTDFVGTDTFLVVADNGAQTSAPVEFTVAVVAENSPFITEITPEIGTTLDNAELTIRGFNFVADDTSVLVAGVEPLSTQTRVGDNGDVEVVVVVAPQPLGQVPVTVTTAAGSSTNVVGFEFGLPDTMLVSAVLPLARSVAVDTPATAFATVVNSGNVSLSNCAFTAPESLASEFHFQTTDPLTNALTGTEDAAIALGPLQSQSYVFSVLSPSPIAPIEIPLEYGCDGQVSVGIADGINVFRLTVEADAVPDVVAVAGTPESQNPAGTLSLPTNTRQQFFVVATSNLGATGDITVTATASDPALPISIQACIDAADCQGATSNVVQDQQVANGTAAYFFLVTADDEVPFDPASNRINVNFTDSAGVLRGSTSVAVTTRICSLDDEVLCALLQ